MNRRKKIAMASLVAAGLSCSSYLYAQDMMFGTPADVDYAEQLWSAMVDKGLAGPGATHSILTEGTEPHGLFEVFYSSASVSGHTGTMLVKRNYGFPEKTGEEVAEDYDGNIRATTVMFRREAGYDPDNDDWFWAMFMPDGTVGQNEMGMSLAGQVAKGMDVGCIACHTNAEGDDYVFTSNAVN